MAFRQIQQQQMKLGPTRGVTMGDIQGRHHTKKGAAQTAIQRQFTSKLQRQALGDMANGDNGAKHEEAKKLFKLCRPSKQTSMVQQPNPNEHGPLQTGLAQDKHAGLQEQPVKARKYIHEKMDMDSTNTDDESEVISGFEDNVRPLASLPMDVTEIAEEVQSKLHIVEDVDENDTDDPHFCTEYVQEIYQYLYQLERDSQPDHHYMDRQTKINHKMRAILIDWLVLVQIKFDLFQETLYLTVSIIDRFLEVFLTTKEQLQLIGVTAMYLAAKYEELYYPQLKDFVYITDDSYSIEQICQMERIILRTLNYKLSPPAPIHFLRRYSKIGKVMARIHMLAKYLMEGSLLDYSMLKYLPSHVAASSLALAMEILSEDQWSPTLEHHSGYTQTEMYPVKVQLAKHLLTVADKRQQAVRDKYSNSRFMKVANDVALTGERVQQLVNDG